MKLVLFNCDGTLVDSGKLIHEVMIRTLVHHGFPEPLRCPEGESRKSIALYYYTLEPNAPPTGRSTNYRARPEDGIGKSALIWLDKEAVDLYSRLKARFGLSDEFASRVLGFLSRKR